MYQQEAIKKTTSVKFNLERLKLNDAISQFNSQINSLKEDLLNYRGKSNASEKYVFYKQQQIKVFESILIAINDNTEITNQIFDANQKEIARLNQEVFKLQGVCLYHGISNLNYYLRMKTNALIVTVKKAFDEGFRQTPFDLIESSSQQEKNKMQISHLAMRAKQIKFNGK